MISSIPALAIAFFSFLCSAFVILRIVIPILPPSPLSRRVSPAEFGLPRFQSLSHTDRSHIWLASLDVWALVIFVWQAMATGGPSKFASDPVSAVRIWFVMTVRQTCLLTVVSITLLHVRMGRPVSFGAKYWMLWAPTVLLVITSTSIAGVIAGAGLQSLFFGIISYTSSVAILSSITFICLICTLVTIKRNLAVLGEEFHPWPSAKTVEEKSRPSFATEDIGAIREGASWITSNASSRRDSISAWSFSTYQTGTVPSHHDHGSDRLHKVSYAFAPTTSSLSLGTPNSHVNDIPIIPPLPSPYGLVSSAAHNFRDPDPFRKEYPLPLPEQPCVRLDSQTSWLTSTNESHTTMSAWSYPTSVGSSIHNVSSLDLRNLTSLGSRPGKPKLAGAQVLGSYGFVHEADEKGLAAFAVPLGNIIDISMFRLFGWLLYVWLPLALSLPYLVVVLQRSVPSTGISVAFILSVTMSSPILAMNILFRSPIPIPSGLFDVHEPNTRVGRVLTGVSAGVPLKYSKEYKRSLSISPTVMEGCRSGDVWITNGDAVEGKTKMGRAMGMLSPMPKLSVLPELEDGYSRIRPLPIRNEDSVNLHSRSHSETSAQFERHRKYPVVGSRLSEARDSLAYAGKIMVAQRHYSALAQTLVVTCPSGKDQSAKADTDKVLGSATGATSANVIHKPIHLRNRSVSSINRTKNSPSDASLTPSPPPTIPLPPTPPRVKAARFACRASSEYSFSPIDDMNEIDSLTSGVLPLFVPGTNVDGMKKGDCYPLSTFNERKDGKAAKKLEEFTGDFSSPEVHSTPVMYRTREQRSRKTFGHKRNRYSLPRHFSFGLGKDDVHSSSRWAAVNQIALKTKIDTTTVAQQLTEASPQSPGEMHRAKSTRSLGLRADVPHGLDTPRDSLSSMVPPFSAASTAALFEEFVAGLPEDPEAQSTPHNTHLIKPTLIHPGCPLSLPEEQHCSNVLYIGSDNHPVPTTPDAETTTSSSTIFALAQWSTRAVRPLIPKVIQFCKGSNTDSSQLDLKSVSGGNLRPLALLQYCDNNIPASPVLNPVRPLALGKKARGATLVQNENAKPDSASSRSKNLKPLKLIQSDTTNIQGILRKG